MLQLELICTAPKKEKKYTQMHVEQHFFLNRYGRVFKLGKGEKGGFFFSAMTFF